MAITFIEETKTFYLENENLTYAFKLNENYLEHLYFGKKIGRDDISYTLTGGTNALFNSPPEGMSYEFKAPEISFYGTGDYREPTVHVINKNGDRLSELLFDSYEILAEKPKISNMPSMTGGETLVIHLKDKVTLFCADLYYTLYEDCNILSRRIVYKNLGKDKIVLDRAYSFTLQLPDNNYKIMSLCGSWARERSIQITPLLQGVITIDSKRTTSSNTLNPFMGILSENATETSGEVIGVNLVYSSSFTLKAQGTHGGDTYISGGINDFDFAWTLESGEFLETPEAVISYSYEGIGAMSRAFHDVYRNHLVNKNFVFKKRPLVINNWEGTSFTFTEEKLKAIIDGVEGTGFDTFVLDDGWFGVRNNEKSGLGDWFVNYEKLPNGLKGISDYAHQKGLKFGLWFEPEMLNIDSDLYRAHPDFAIQTENRPHCTGRGGGQLVLDLTRKDVRDYIVNVINTVLHENDIDYFKWDSNRCITESVSKGLPAEKQREFAHRYALGLYDIMDRIILANPHIFFEGCSGGGARFDAAMLYYFPQTWTSDNTDIEERTLIQYGTSICYPLSSMSCHVTAVHPGSVKRNAPIKCRADIAGLGAFGYELDASSFTDEDRQTAKEIVDEYKEWNADLILKGDLYRIKNPFESNYFAEAVVSKDKTKAILVFYQRKFTYNGPKPHVKMAGLDENKTYFVPELEKSFKGSTLMSVGLVPYMRGDFLTQKYHFIEK